MAQIEFEANAKDRIRNLINYISQNKYSEISSIAMIDPSWYSENETQEDGIRVFEEWIKGQLQLWADYNGREFVVDPYMEKQLNLRNVEDEVNQLVGEYTPTSHGEELEFWFELDVYKDENDNLILCFNVNC